MRKKNLKKFEKKVRSPTISIEIYLFDLYIDAKKKFYINEVYPMIATLLFIFYHNWFLSSGTNTPHFIGFTSK